MGGDLAEPIDEWALGEVAGAELKINPFGAVADYPASLNKIATGTFFAVLGGVLLIGWRIPAAHRLMSSLPVMITIGDWSVPLAAAIIALCIAVITRSLKWHDRISDIFEIRQQFDVSVILLPLAVGVGAQLSPVQLSRLKASRRDVMRSVFYHYTEEQNPILTARSVTMALDQWSWYWIVAEVTSVALVTAVVLLGFGDANSGALLLLFVLAAMLLLQLIRNQCNQYAAGQVATLLADQAAAAAIRQEFLAI